jgi:hypothetical protein
MQIPTPTDRYRIGRQLSEGKVEVTIRSLGTDRHVIIEVACRKRDPQTGRWGRASWAEATVVFASHKRTRVATMFPKSDQIDWKTDDPALRWALQQILVIAAGADVDDHIGSTLGQTVEDSKAEVLVRHGGEFRTANRCGRCWMKLDDPVSIDRGIGPVCLGKSTGSKAYKVAA